MSVLTGANVLAQSTVPTVFAGYGVVGIVIGESQDAQGITGSSQTFRGNGPLLGAGMQIGNRIFVDFNYLRTKGTSSENTLNNQYTYKIDGCQMPINVTYLLRLVRNLEIGANPNFSVIGTYGISDSFMLRYTFKNSQQSSN